MRALVLALAPELRRVVPFPEDAKEVTKVDLVGLVHHARHLTGRERERRNYEKRKTALLRRDW